MANLVMKIKWERVIGLIVFAFAVIFIWKHSFFISSKEAFINADVHNVCSPIFGQLKMDDLVPAKTLNKGELLFEVDNPRIGGLPIFADYYELKQRIELIEMDIKQDNISFAKFKADLLRNWELSKIGAVSKETVRDILFKMNLLKISLHSKENRLPKLKESLNEMYAQLKLHENGIVDMPVDGVIWAVFRKDGDFVKAGDMVLQVIDINRFWVDAFFDEGNSKYLSSGTIVTVNSLGDKKHWEGKVMFVRKGGISEEGINSVRNTVRLNKKDEEKVVCARIEVKLDSIYSPFDFYGYGKSVNVHMKKGIFSGKF